MNCARPVRLINPCGFVEYKSIGVEMSELEILREFYETVKSQNHGVGSYFLTFSNRVKDALDVCDEKLSHLSPLINVNEKRRGESAHPSSRHIH